MCFDCQWNMSKTLQKSQSPAATKFQFQTHNLNLHVVTAVKKKKPSRGYFLIIAPCNHLSINDWCIAFVFSLADFVMQIWHHKRVQMKKVWT